MHRSGVNFADPQTLNRSFWRCHRRSLGGRSPPAPDPRQTSHRSRAEAEGTGDVPDIIGEPGRSDRRRPASPGECSATVSGSGKLDSNRNVADSMNVLCVLSLAHPPFRAHTLVQPLVACPRPANSSHEENSRCRREIGSLEHTTTRPQYTTSHNSGQPPCPPRER